MRYIFFIVGVCVVFTYASWFQLDKSFSGGDWPYLYKENIQAFQLFHSPFLWLEPYYQITAKIGVQVLSLSWETSEKLFWFYPFLIISVLSSFFLIRSVLKSSVSDSNKDILSAFGALIFTTNTYILMIVGGGQMGVAMSYAFAPLVLHRLLFSAISKRKNFIVGLVMSSIQLMFDPRIWLIIIFTVFLYAIFNYFHQKKLCVSIKDLIAILLGSVVLNLFWMLPNILFYTKEYSSVKETSDVGFLSVASFSNTISLLHPNWPENLFGKVYFMKPEFLLIPILAFLWVIVKKSNNKNILFFSLLAFLGSFLAKGTNSPFGFVYELLYKIPGFTLFRDSTKWYILIAISYSILIPYTIEVINANLHSRFSSIKNKQLLLFSVIVLFLGIWVWSLHPAFTHSLTGTFKPKTVPLVYLDYKKFLLEKPELFSTLWIPHYQRFGFHSDIHPAIDADDFFGSSDTKKIINLLKNQNIVLKLQKKDVKYIVVPFDSEKEIFLKDYAYSETERTKLISLLDIIPWLKKLDLFNGKITMYQVKSKN